MDQDQMQRTWPEAFEAVTKQLPTSEWKFKVVNRRGKQRLYASNHTNVTFVWDGWWRPTVRM